MKKRLFISLLLCAVLLCSLGLTAFAAGLDPVTDAYGLLTEYEVQELSSMAQKLEEDYGCSAYIIIVNDYREIAPNAPDAKTAAEDIYLGYELGYGSGREGVLLMLSMAERDYAFVSYGENTHRAFTDYGQEYVESNMLPELGEDDWYDAFWSFLYDLDWLWDQAAKGTPYDVEGAGSTSEGAGLIAFPIGIVVAAVVCLIMRAQMKTAKLSTEANNYMAENGVNMRVVQDLYTHTSVSRRIIEEPKSNSSGGGGGTTINSRGFSGRSGKF